MWTINDFPAYGNLCGCTVKGFKACPICGEETTSIRLQYGKKMYTWDTGNICQDIILIDYKKKKFDGKQEHGKPPQPLSGEAIYFKLKEMIFSCGKKCGKNNNEGGNDYWKRRSEFFELPYWKNLHVRHCLDVMHIEKNVCMNIVGTLLDIPGKSKDGMNTRLHLVEMNIRPKLARMVIGNRTYIPVACYTLSRKEKYWFCKTVWN